MRYAWEMRLICGKHGLLVHTMLNGRSEATWYYRVRYSLSLSLQSLAGAQPFDRDTLRVGEKVYH